MSFGGLSIRLLPVSGCWKSIIEWKVPATNYRTSAGEAAELNFRPRKRRAHWCRPGCRRRCCPFSECHRPPCLTGKFPAMEVSVWQNQWRAGLFRVGWDRCGGKQILRSCHRSGGEESGPLSLAPLQIDEQGPLAVLQNSYKRLELPNGA